MILTVITVISVILIKITSGYQDDICHGYCYQYDTFLDLLCDAHRGCCYLQTLAAFHGAPAMCPTPDAAETACCIHGMPTFPHWHRLYTVEVSALSS